eukprot:CAMPEP_0177652660 /NCGR_PEP_ID=MMETSP0447-20121125/13259_1 /TAXON_ID=0 /ORGANISM="Stygamoeba regulata, Strain BSH-02190019" /LENGTH=682 /DNA_ID=CAMNT_0019155941 /DNA_START=129 /DNA_END=2177 /DNA_ORIENTATION=-
MHSALLWVWVLLSALVGTATSQNPTMQLHPMHPAPKPEAPLVCSAELLINAPTLTTIAYSGKFFGDMGDYDGCKQDPYFHLCLVYFGIAGPQKIELPVGICIPKTCDTKILEGFGSALLPQLKKLSTEYQITRVVCADEHSEGSLSFGAWATIGVCIFFIAAAVLGSIYASPYATVLLMPFTSSHSMANGQEFSAEKGLLMNVVENEEPADDVESDGTAAVGSDGSAGKGKAAKVESFSTVPLIGEYWHSVAKSFSLPHNFQRLFSPLTGNLTTLNGIRVISMLWVILGHTYIGRVQEGFSNIAYTFPDLLNRFSFLIITQAPFSVDTFFWMSGFLGAYGLIKEVAKKGIRGVNWPMLYIHRFIRILPVYMFVILVYLQLSPYFADGPQWYMYEKVISHTAPQWWYNLLFINNFVDIRRQTLGWSWYLANDMQFFVVLPIFIVAHAIHELMGWALVLLGVVGCLVSRMVIVLHYDIGLDSVLGADAGQDSFNQLYQKPWSRIAPYLLGVATAFLYLRITRSETRKVKLHPLVVLAGFAVSIGILGAMLFITYKQQEYWNRAAVVAFYTLERFVWSLGLSGFCLLLFLGYGGALHHFLSVAIWDPLARLTYGAYLVHLIFITVVAYSDRVLYYYRDWSIVMNYVTNAIFAYVIAFGVWMFVEKPIMNLEGILLSFFQPKAAKK